MFVFSLWKPLKHTGNNVYPMWLFCFVCVCVFFFVWQLSQNLFKSELWFKAMTFYFNVLEINSFIECIQNCCRCSLFSPFFSEREFVYVCVVLKVLVQSTPFLCPLPTTTKSYWYRIYPSIKTWCNCLEV